MNSPNINLMNKSRNKNRVHSLGSQQESNRSSKESLGHISLSLSLDSMSLRITRSYRYCYINIRANSRSSYRNVKPVFSRRVRASFIRCRSRRPTSLIDSREQLMRFVTKPEMIVSGFYSSALYRRWDF